MNKIIYFYFEERGLNNLCLLNSEDFDDDILEKLNFNIVNDEYSDCKRYYTTILNLGLHEFELDKVFIKKINMVSNSRQEFINCFVFKREFKTLESWNEFRNSINLGQ